MADLAAIRQAIADALTAAGHVAHPDSPEQLHPPAALVDVQDVDFRTAMQRGHEKWTFLVRYLCGTASLAGALKERTAVFGGAKDIKDAIEGHVPLRDGTAAHDAFVAEARRFDAWEYGGVTYLGVEFVVDVYA